MKSWTWALLGISLLGSPASAGVLAPALRALVRQGVPKAEWGRVPSSPFAPRIDRSGRVQVVIRPQRRGGALPPVPSLKALGAVGVHVSRLMDVIQMWVPVASLRAVAALPDVGWVGVPTYAVARPLPTDLHTRLGNPTANAGAPSPSGSRGSGDIGPFGLGMLLLFALLTEVRRGRGTTSRDVLRAASKRQHREAPCMTHAEGVAARVRPRAALRDGGSDEGELGGEPALRGAILLGWRRCRVP